MFDHFPDLSIPFFRLLKVKIRNTGAGKQQQKIPIKVFKRAERRNSCNNKVSKDKYTPQLCLVFLSTLLSVLAAFCVLYNRKEHSQGLSIIQTKIF